MKVLVTGGAGFIGSHLCDALLAHEHEVRVLDNLSTGSRDNLKKDVELIVDDVRNQDAVAKAFSGVDACFHLAAMISVVAPTNQRIENLEINLAGSLNIFQAAIAAGRVPVSFASSCAVYGDSDNLPLKESEVIAPISAYACDKYAAELNAYYFAYNAQLPVISCRFFNVYGPRQSPHSPYSGVISKFIHWAKQGEPLKIYGDGTQTRDFIYVGDVVKALLLSMSIADTNSKVFNVCSGTAIDITTLARKIELLSTNQSDIVYESARRADIKHSCGDTSYASSLGFTAQHSLDDGLRELIHEDYLPL